MHIHMPINHVNIYVHIHTDDIYLHVCIHLYVCVPLHGVDILVSTITLLPIWITQYRWAPIRVILLKEKKGFKELSTIVSFAGLLGRYIYMYIYMCVCMYVYTHIICLLLSHILKSPS